MIVMPANNSNAHKLAQQFPGQLGLLLSPGPKKLPWAIDNGMFSAWVKSGRKLEEYEQKEHWDSWEWLWMLTQIKSLQETNLCEFIVVPDVVCNPRETIRSFFRWETKLAGFMSMGVRLAMAVQDGMEPADVPEHAVCFLGGSKAWKWANVERFGAECEFLHVGGVNSYEGLWKAHDAGAMSCDGTGWFRGDRRQLHGLLRYLRESRDGTLHEKQMALF